MSGASAENEPQIKAPRVTPLEGVSTYALQGIRVRGVENPQGFGIDERRFIATFQRCPRLSAVDIVLIIMQNTITDNV